MPTPADGPVTVLAVDDQDVFRRAVRELIAATPGFEQVGEAASGEEALALAGALHPDLVLLDVRMPGMDGLETSRRLRRAEPDTVVVLVSIAPSPDALRDGDAAACLRKQDLSPISLARVWHAHGGAGASTAP